MLLVYVDDSASGIQMMKHKWKNCLDRFIYFQLSGGYCVFRSMHLSLAIQQAMSVTLILAWISSVSVGFQQERDTTWLKSLERVGYGWRKAGLYGEPWEKPISSLRHFSADIMIMMMSDVCGPTAKRTKAIAITHWISQMKRQCAIHVSRRTAKTEE